MATTEPIDPFDYEPQKTTQGRPGWEKELYGIDPFDYEQKGPPPQQRFTEGMSGPERFATGFNARIADASQNVVGAGIGTLNALFPTGRGVPEMAAWKEKREKEFRPVSTNIMSDPVAHAGSIGADIVNTAPMPFGRLLPAVTANAAYQGLTNPGDPFQRGVQAGIGGVAGAGAYGLASGLSKLSNAPRGRYGENQNQMELSKAARESGVDLSIGDLEKQGMTRAVENANPFRHRRLDAQAEELGHYLTAGGTRENIIADSFKNSYDAAGKRVNAMYQQLDNFITAPVPGGQWLPGISANETRSTLKQIYSKYPQLIDSIPNQETKALVQALGSAKPGATMTFQEMDTLRKAVGKLSGYFERQAGGVAPQKGVDSEAASLFRKLYSSTYKDMEGWASQSKATGKAFDLFKAARDTYKAEMLPFERFSLSKGSLHGKYDERPQDFLFDLLNPRNRTQLESLYGKLDDEGKKAVQITLSADRAAKKFFSSAEPTIGPGGYLVGGASLFEPTAGAGAAAAAFLQNRMTTSPAMKSLYFADPRMFRGPATQLAPQSLVGGLRQVGEYGGRKQAGPKREDEKGR